MRQPRGVQAVPLALFESDEAWSNISGTAANTAEPYVGFGMQSRQLVSTAASVASCELALTSTWMWDAAYPIMEFLVYVDNAAVVSRISFYASVDAAYAKHFLLSLPAVGKAQTLVNGWNVIRVDQSMFTAVGGAVASDWQNINKLKIVAQAIATNNLTAYIASWRIVKPPAIVLLDHDDGLASSKKAWEIEEYYGLRSTNYVNTRSTRIGYNATYVTWDDLWGAYGRGHDVCNHTYDHERLSTLDATNKALAIGRGYRALYGRGFTRSAKYFATPYGEYGSDIAAAATPYAYMVRVGGGAGGSKIYPAVYPYGAVDSAQSGHRYFDVNSLNVTLTQAKSDIDALIAAPGTVKHILTHRVSDDVTDAMTCSVSTYDGLCAYIASKVDAGQLACMTISQFYEQGLGSLIGQFGRYGLSMQSGALIAQRRI